LSLGVIVCNAARGPERALPLGAWLRADDEVVSGSVVDSSTRPAMFPHDPHAIAATAVQRFAGTPYQWGGVTPWGADCSGLVQTTFWLHGMNLPRDAWMQAERGAEVTEGVEAWRAGDLAFFSDRPDRRITHVGIALGDARLVHLALGRGGYAVERLTDSRDPYVTSLITRLVTVRRVS
jgi:cell wall-associated NlpC family hydrolase